MNPFFNQQQINQQLSQGFNQQANFQGVGNLGVQNQFQQAWPQQGLIAMQPQMQQPMQPYQYPYQAAQLAYQMPTQQMQNFAAAQMPQQSKNQNNAPPLPKADQPLPPVPEPPQLPPPENPAKPPAPPPEEPRNKSSQNQQVGEKQEMKFQSSLEMGTSTSKPKVALSGNEDLESLNNQLRQLEAQMKKYQLEYEKWHKEFTNWRKQHENHPDQKQYVEYQQKYQKMIEKQQQSLQQQYMELQKKIKSKEENLKKPQMTNQNLPNPQAQQSLFAMNAQNNSQMNRNVSSQNQSQFAGQSNFGQSQQQNSVSASPSSTTKPGNSQGFGGINYSEMGITREHMQNQSAPKQQYNESNQSRQINQMQERQQSYQMSNQSNYSSDNQQNRSNSSNWSKSQNSNQWSSNQGQGNQRQSNQGPPNSSYNQWPQNQSPSTSMSNNQWSANQGPSNQGSSNQGPSNRGPSSNSSNQRFPNQNPPNSSNQFGSNKQSSYQWSNKQPTNESSLQSGPNKQNPQTNSQNIHHERQGFQQQQLGVRPRMPFQGPGNRPPNQMQQKPRNANPASIPSLMSQTFSNQEKYQKLDMSKGGDEKNQAESKRPDDPNSKLGGNQQIQSSDQDEMWNDDFSQDPNFQSWEDQAPQSSGQQGRNQTLRPNIPGQSFRQRAPMSQPVRQPLSSRSSANSMQGQWARLSNTRNIRPNNTAGTGSSGNNLKPRINSAPPVRPPLENNDTTTATSSVSSSDSNATSTVGPKTSSAPSVEQPDKNVNSASQPTTTVRPSFTARSAPGGPNRPVLRPRGVPGQPVRPQFNPRGTPQSGLRGPRPFRGASPASSMAQTSSSGSRPTTPASSSQSQSTSLRPQFGTRGPQQGGVRGPRPVRGASPSGGMTSGNATGNRPQFVPRGAPQSSMRGPRPVRGASPASGQVGSSSQDNKSASVRPPFGPRGTLQGGIRGPRPTRPPRDKTNATTPAFVHTRIAETKIGQCKFFPNCNFGLACKFAHPKCADFETCRNKGCCFDHPRQKPGQSMEIKNVAQNTKSPVKQPLKDKPAASGTPNQAQKPTAPSDEKLQPDEGAAKTVEKTGDAAKDNDATSSSETDKNADIADPTSNTINKDGDVEPANKEGDQTAKGNEPAYDDRDQAHKDGDHHPTLDDQAYRDGAYRENHPGYGDDGRAYRDGNPAYRDDYGRGYDSPQARYPQDRPGYPRNEYDHYTVGQRGGYEDDRYYVDRDRASDLTYGRDPNNDRDGLRRVVDDYDRQRPMSPHGQRPLSPNGGRPFSSHAHRSISPLGRRPQSPPRHRGMSPPRRESFREQQDFENRYREWEREHFPVEDPTREWEYELRRRQLLGQEEIERNRFVDALPPRDYPPLDYRERDYRDPGYRDGDRLRYEEDLYRRPLARQDSRDRLFDDRRPYLDDPFYDRRPHDTIRPAVFDYDHSTKLNLYDVDIFKLDGHVSETSAPLPPVDTPIDDQAGTSVAGSAIDEGSLWLRSPPRKRSRSRSPRRRSHSRSPKKRTHSRSPRRRSRSRSPRRRPRSRSPGRLGSRRSRSPKRRSSRRSRSPRRRSPRHKSPSQDRRRDREPPQERSREKPRPSVDRLREDPFYRAARGELPLSEAAREFIGVKENTNQPRMQVFEPVVREPGPEITAIQDLLDKPGRDKRPKQIVIILRGPPGCGKTHIARLIKDKEVKHGAHAPRILALDDYFITESDVFEKDADTGKKVKVKKMEYVYEKEMEPAYRVSLLKSFNKTLDNGYFPMVIIDAVNDKVEHFQKFWSDGKHKGFEVYIAEMQGDAFDCAEKNIHNWSQEDIEKILDSWEPTPNHFKRLDVRSLVQDAAIKEVEMEEIEAPAEEEKIATELEEKDEEVDEEEYGTFHVPTKSKWEESKEEQLAKLDGIRPSKGKKRDAIFDDDYDDDPYDEKEEDMRIGKKRVRWADIEERKQMEHRKRIGFCIGTDWSVLTDQNAEIPL